MHLTRLTGSLALFTLVAACGGEPPADTGSGSSTGAAPLGVSYYKNAKPIFDAKCVSCHYDGGIAPFTMTDYATAQQYAGLIKKNVADKTMPPWPPGEGCADYVANRSLSDEQMKTVLDWVDGGAVEGDAKDEGKPIDVGPTYALSRVDLHLPIPEVYTPQKTPDDYHCFIVDWPKDKVAYVTGFRANPGNAKVVHHVIAYLAPPSVVADAQKLDDAEPGPGYTCFGGPGLGASGSDWIGAWAPGSLGTDYPPGTGIKIDPGSKVILQVHYNTLTGGPQPDQTSIDFKVDDTVTTEAHIQPWTNPQWLGGQTMKIAAFDADAHHAFSYDPTPYVSNDKSFTMYSANLHMHQLGTHAKISIKRQGGAEECMLEIPKWNFHWQGSYGFSQPKVVNPGDEVALECHWNNTPPMQPTIDGQKQMPKDVYWGEGTTDEMCLGGFYMTE